MEKKSNLNSSIEETWIAIVQGIASSGELSPESLGANGGADRVRTLSVHAAGLAKVFHAEYVKANGKDLP